MQPKQGVTAAVQCCGLEALQSGDLLFLNWRSAATTSRTMQQPIVFLSKNCVTAGCTGTYECTDPRLAQFFAIRGKSGPTHANATRTGRRLPLKAPPRFQTKYLAMKPS